MTRARDTLSDTLRLMAQRQPDLAAKVRVGGRLVGEASRAAKLSPKAKPMLKRDTLSFTLPYPPSVNRYWRHPMTGKLAGRHLVSEEGREYRERVRAAVDYPAEPMEGPLSVQIFMHPPDKRRRDVDNINKAVLDALRLACVYHDDSQIDVLRIERCAVTKPGYVMVNVAALTPSPEQKR